MISINLTVHNKGFLIERVLESIKKFTYSDYEIIIVIDGCIDDSENIVTKFFEENKDIKHKMIINEYNWDVRILKPFKFGDIFAVTARTAHNWEINKNSKHIKEKFERDDCWSDVINHTDHANLENLGRDTFGIRSCVNRGPLAIKKDIFDLMGGFDESFCPQDSDDHDFCYPIDYISNEEWGGTRDENGTKKWMFKANQKNSKLLLERHKDLMINTDKIIENRKLV